jgi:hypothetical protein
LIIANGGDKVCGAERPYQYFKQYYERGAPWTFVVQNNIPHCCIGNAKNLILTWLEAMIKRRLPTVISKPLRPVSRRSGWSAFFKAELTATKDEWGVQNCRCLVVVCESDSFCHFTALRPELKVPPTVSRRNTFILI